MAAASEVPATSDRQPVRRLQRVAVAVAGQSPPAGVQLEDSGFSAGEDRGSCRCRRVGTGGMLHREPRLGEASVSGRVNLAGRAGRWSASHWKTAAFGWIVFAVLAVVVGSIVGVRQMKPWAIANGESRRAEQILDQGSFKIPARESVLVQSQSGTTVDQDALFSAAVGSVVQTLAQQPDVGMIVVPDRASERRPDLGGSPLRARAVRRRRARPTRRRTRSRRSSSRWPVCSPRFRASPSRSSGRPPPTIRSGSGSSGTWAGSS